MVPAIPEAGPVVANGVAERYEIWDIETGDLLVIYRLPFEPDLH